MKGLVKIKKTIVRSAKIKICHLKSNFVSDKKIITREERAAQIVVREKVKTSITTKRTVKISQNHGKFE